MHSWKYRIGDFYFHRQGLRIHWTILLVAFYSVTQEWLKHFPFIKHISIYVLKAKRKLLMQNLKNFDKIQTKIILPT